MINTLPDLRAAFEALETRVATIEKNYAWGAAHYSLPPPPWKGLDSAGRYLQACFADPVQRSRYPDFVDLVEKWIAEEHKRA